MSSIATYLSLRQTCGLLFDPSLFLTSHVQPCQFHVLPPLQSAPFSLNPTAFTLTPSASPGLPGSSHCPEFT